MNKKLLRELAIVLLQDYHGIEETSYNILKELLYENDSGDINNAVEKWNGRVYIDNDIASELLRDISKWEEAFVEDENVQVIYGDFHGNK